MDPTDSFVFSSGGVGDGLDDCKYSIPGLRPDAALNDGVRLDSYNRLSRLICLYFADENDPSEKTSHGRLRKRKSNVSLLMKE
jgi:hypothetical protein